MKKLTAVFLLLFLLIPPAFADAQSWTYRLYSDVFISNAEKYGLPSLVSVPEENAIGSYSPSIYVFFLDGEHPKYMLGCQCPEDDLDYFLLTCSCLVFTADVNIDKTDTDGRLLELYFKCLKDENNGFFMDKTGTGVFMQMQKADGFYTFVAGVM